MTAHEHDYDLQKKVKITFRGMDYFVMPRYRHHYLDLDYERFSLQILKNNLSADSLFIDIGAHYGPYSLVAAKESGSKVMAFEPVPENIALLKENIAVNKLGTLIEPYQHAASDENGEAEFNIPWASDSAGFYDHPNAETIRKLKVTMRKVDDLVGAKKVDIIKIDTEGHEVSVLKGLKRTLEKNPHAELIIELNPPLLKNAGVSARELIDYIKSFDKEVYMVDEDKFCMYRITNRPDDWKLFINAENYANLYCVPAKNHQYAVFVSHSSQMSGAEMAMLEQILALRKRGVLSHVIVPRQGTLVQKLFEYGIGYSVVEEYSFWVDTPETSQRARELNYWSVQSSVTIAHIVKDLNPTVVINNSLVNPWGYPAAQVNGLPLVWMVHEFGDTDHGLHLTHPGPIMRGFVRDVSDAVITCSDAVKHSIVDAPGNTKGNVHTVYNLLDVKVVEKKAAESVASPFKSKGALRLGMIGTITPGKGQSYAIEAVSELKKQGIKAEFVIIGSGQADYIALLKKQIKALGLQDSVHLLGFKNNPYPYIRLCDAFVVASNSEAFGRVTAEAMIVKTPVIASNQGGSLEMIIPGKTGFLFESQNVPSLVTAIKKLQKTPKQELERLTNHAKEHIEELLDTDKNTSKLMKVLQALEVTEEDKERRNVMVHEWVAAWSVYDERLAGSKAETEQAEARFNEQVRINQELLATIHSIRTSRSFKLARRLAGVKNIIKPKHP